MAAGDYRQAEASRDARPDRCRLIWAAVALLLSIHAALLAWGAYRHSPTFDEPGHLVAGISHWRFGRFELYRVNPPLVRMVAALPMLAVGCNTDWKQFRDTPGARSEFPIGEDFIAANGERSLWLVTLARWACIPFSLIGGTVCFLWGRELYGVGAGLLALILWCFEPNILAHGQLITPDAAATAFGLLAGYLFWRWLKQPTWLRAMLAGLALGLAELSKASWVILYALWPLLWLTWRWTDAETRRSPRDWSRQSVQLMTILAISLYILNLGYAFDGWLTRLRDCTFVSRTLTGLEQSGQPGNRFADSWLGELPLPVPKQYVLGIDAQKRDFEETRRPSYLRGEWKEGGWWYYYLYGLLVKVPHGTQLLFLLASITFVTQSAGNRIVLSRNDLVLLAPALVLLVLVSSQTGFNQHVRYVLPCLGIFLIFAGRAIFFLARSKAVARMVIGSTLLWTLISSLAVYPHSLSYFNELAGGAEDGHRHLLHSNIDWGQDLIYLDEWIDAHPKPAPLYVIYYGGFDPRDLGIECDIPHLCGSPTDRPMLDRSPGRYAVSINWLMADCSPGERALPALVHQRPIARIGYSIYIFEVSSNHGE